MRDEYDFTGGVRGKYAEAMKVGYMITIHNEDGTTLVKEVPPEGTIMFRAKSVTVSDDTLSVDLVDGHTISVPITWYPRLVGATAEERSHWRLIGQGEGIHWPDLDEDISVANLLSENTNDI